MSVEPFSTEARLSRAASSLQQAGLDVLNAKPPPLRLMVLSDEIWIVDDDERVRESLTELLGSAGYAARAFGSGAEVLAVIAGSACGCLILDLRLHGESGLRLQASLADKHLDIPVIFISGHADVPVSVQAMKAGATDFLQKPVREQDLLDAISIGLERAAERRARRESLNELRARRSALSAREGQVLALVVDGRLNKQIAGELGISEVMVKTHRASVLRKMGAGSLAELVRMEQRLGQT